MYFWGAGAAGAECQAGIIRALVLLKGFRYRLGQPNLRLRWRKGLTMLLHTQISMEVHATYVLACMD